MKKIITLILLALPNLIFAQRPLHDIDDVATRAVSIGNLTITLAISLAVVWIIISVIRYFVIDEGEDARKAGGMAILFGVVGLFVILSIWGLVYLLTNSFKFTQNTRPPINHIMIPDPVTGAPSINR